MFLISTCLSIPHMMVPLSFKETKFRMQSSWWIPLPSELKELAIDMVATICINYMYYNDTAEDLPHSCQPSSCS